MALREGALVLADGSVFEGELIGAEAPGGVATGEVVFNTVLSGYQEVITDPSYAGQIIAFTNPHIGNYGVSTGRTSRPGGRSAAAWSSGSWPGAARAGAATATSTTCSAGTASAASPGSTPAG